MYFVRRAKDSIFVCVCENESVIGSWEVRGQRLFHIPEQVQLNVTKKNSRVLKVISCSLPAAIMRRSQQYKANRTDLPQLKCVTRLGNIPIVETGWSFAGQMYTRIKNSNSLVYWTLGTAETSFNTALEVALPPTVAVFEGPITAIDNLVCKSLDIVEQRVPNIYLPPQMMIWETKQYFSSKFVRPVLKRADSVKQMGNQVLASKYTVFAADKLEDALCAADKYVDIYLPADAADQTRDECDAVSATAVDGPTGKALDTMHHVDRFSRKLQRRLTKRTLAEAKALKARSQESIHVLLYLAELVATDPRLAVEKACQLWETLSENEPENQARPTTLEQLIVMLTRESARRLVHFVNFTRSAITQLPDTVSMGVHFTNHHCMQLVDRLVKSIHWDDLTIAATNGAKLRVRRVSLVIQDLNVFANAMLERLAIVLAGQIEQKKSVRTSPKHRNNYQHRSPPSIPTPPAFPTTVIRNQNRITHRPINNSVINNGSQATA